MQVQFGMRQDYTESAPTPLHMKPRVADTAERDVSDVSLQRASLTPLHMKPRVADTAERDSVGYSRSVRKKISVSRPSGYQVAPEYPEEPRGAAARGVYENLYSREDQEIMKL
ncbi:hypothetical protein ACJJTC_018768 [Scirpophaga incertulas]